MTNSFKLNFQHANLSYGFASGKTMYDHIVTEVICESSTLAKHES